MSRVRKSLVVGLRAIKVAQVLQLSLQGAKLSTERPSQLHFPEILSTTPRPEKGKRKQDLCLNASTTHSPLLSPAVPEPDLLVIVATNDDMVPTHHVITVGKNIDGPRAYGTRRKARSQRRVVRS